MTGWRLCRRVATVMLAWWLGGCLVDEKNVMDPASAVDVPGLAGAWKPLLDEEGTQLIISMDGNRRYSASFLAKGKAPAKYSDVFFVPVAGRANTYAASLMPEMESGKEAVRLVMLVKLRAKTLEVRFYDEKDIVPDASRAGVPMNGLALQPGAHASVLSYYGKRAAEPFRSGIAFQRIGWFSTEATKQMSLETAEAAAAAGHRTEAARILDSLARRGHRDAQFRLAGMLARGDGVQQHPATAIFLYKSAHLWGHPKAAAALARYLETSRKPGESGFEEALHWYAVQGLLPGQSPAATAAGRDAALKHCQARPADKRPIAAAECAERLMELDLLQVQARMQTEQVEDGLAEAVMAREMLKERASRQRKEIGAEEEQLEREQVRLKALQDEQKRQEALDAQLQLQKQQLAREKAKLKALQDEERRITEQLRRR